ncbi:hypothetical protein M9194_09210 [Vibrio sp. S4M6]|uniref:hypothetical protein n=1 Tax=Vibrio sinus TaxID=2946865 RepID=UPI00202A33EB|nr:hypothetical protein [Vibrio sinus]MCL9781603.1 hypothetical protein [Vibrio sinus]
MKYALFCSMLLSTTAFQSQALIIDNTSVDDYHYRVLTDNVETSSGDILSGQIITLPGGGGSIDFLIEMAPLHAQGQKFHFTYESISRSIADPNDQSRVANLTAFNDSMSDTFDYRNLAVHQYAPPLGSDIDEGKSKILLRNHAKAVYFFWGINEQEYPISSGALTVPEWKSKDNASHALAKS